MKPVEAALAAVDRHLPEFIEELRALCRLHSTRDDDLQMLATAEFIANAIRQVGGWAEVVPWDQSHPFVIGEFGSAPKRLLHHTHYDVEVQPTGDDSAWISPPYAAMIREGALYARGVADDKGALMSSIHAAASFRHAGLDLPVTLRLLVEGKRRLDSPGLASFAAAYSERLHADACIWENSWVDSQGRLLIKLGLKGLLYLELAVRSLKQELTSQNAVILPNAAWRLVWALTTLMDSSGRVLVPGFYEHVRVPSDPEVKLMRDCEFDSEYLLQRAGLEHFVEGVSIAEAGLMTRMTPTITIGGIEGGNLSDDITLGIPAAARAKVEMRLVPDQDPELLCAAIRSHLDSEGFPDVSIRVMGAARPRNTHYGHPFVALVGEAAARVYGTQPVVEPYTVWSGGNQLTYPDMPIVGVGVARADSNADGPNEHILLEDYRKGIKHIIEIMAAMVQPALAIGGIT